MTREFKSRFLLHYGHAIQGHYMCCVRRSRAHTARLFSAQSELGSASYGRSRGIGKILGRKWGWVRFRSNTTRTSRSSLRPQRHRKRGSARQARRRGRRGQGRRRQAQSLLALQLHWHLQREERLVVAVERQEAGPAHRRVRGTGARRGGPG